MARERLQSYSIHERAATPSDRVARAEELEFVKDGFVGAVVPFPPWWLARRGVWFGVFAYVAAAVAILLTAKTFELPWVVILIAFAGLHLFFAGEADEMYRARLASNGWTMVAQVTGTSRLDCERRFLDQWLRSQPVAASAAVNSAPPIAAQSARSGSILGNLLAPLRGRAAK